MALTSELFELVIAAAIGVSVISILLHKSHRKVSYEMISKIRKNLNFGDCKGRNRNEDFTKCFKSF